MFGYAKVQLTVPACLNSPVSPKTYDAKNSDKFKEILSLFSESVVDKFWCCMLSGGNLIGSDVITFDSTDMLSASHASSLTWLGKAVSGCGARQQLDPAA